MVGISILAFSLNLFIPFSSSSAAEMQDSFNKEQQSTLYFTCEHSMQSEGIFCDRSNGEVYGYQLLGKGESVLAHLSNSSPNYIASKKGQALLLDESHLETLEIPNSASINSPQFSISFWIKGIESDGGGYGHIVSHVNAEYDSGWFIDLTDDPHNSYTTISFSVTSTAGKTVKSSLVLAEKNTFVHIVGIFDGVSVMLYKDGTPTLGIPFQGDYSPDPSAPLRIGGSAYDQTDLQYHFAIDDIIYFSEALTLDEVSELHAGDLELSHNVAGNWPLDGNLLDLSGNGIDGHLETFLASMAFSPDGRLFFTEKNTGLIRIMKNNSIIERPFAAVPGLRIDWEQGLLGLALDPNFEDNHFVYAYYTHVDDNDTDRIYNRIVRFVDRFDIGENMTIILDQIPATNGFHSGGAMAFGQDGLLYVTVGDGAMGLPAQDPNSWLGKVLRINPDGTIPSDNPYPKSPVYNIGHRNMFGIAFNDAGYGIVTENGENKYDEINNVKKAENYGYPTFQPKDMDPGLASPSKSTLPLRAYRITHGPTQAIFYDGDKIPEFKNKFLFGTFTGWIFALSIDENSGQVIREERIDLNPEVYEPIIGLAQSPDGDLYYGGYTIHKLTSVGEEAQIVYPITITPANGVMIKSVNLDAKTNTLAINLIPDCIDDLTSFGSNIQVRIPTKLIENVRSVTNGRGENLDYEVESPGSSIEPKYLNLTVNYSESNLPTKILLSSSPKDIVDESYLSVDENDDPYSASIDVTNTKFTINYNMWEGELISATARPNTTSLSFEINAMNRGRLGAILPLDLIDVKSNDSDIQDHKLRVQIDGKDVAFTEQMTESSRNIQICFPEDAQTIEIFGTSMAPEFNPQIVALLAVSILVSTLLVRNLGFSRSRGSMDR